MLVITAEQTELLHQAETFKLVLWELLLLGLLVIVLSGAIYLLHRVRTEPQEPLSEATANKSNPSLP